MSSAAGSSSISLLFSKLLLEDFYHTVSSILLCFVTGEYYVHVKIVNVYGKDIQVVTTLQDSQYRMIVIKSGADYTIETTVDSPKRIEVTAFESVLFSPLKINNKPASTIYPTSVRGGLTTLYVETSKSSINNYLYKYVV